MSVPGNATGLTVVQCIVKLKRGQVGGASMLRCWFILSSASGRENRKILRGVNRITIICHVVLPDLATDGTGRKIAETVMVPSFMLSTWPWLSRLYPSVKLLFIIRGSSCNQADQTKCKPLFFCIYLNIR